MFLGAGGDHVNIETLTTHARRASSFGKDVDIELEAATTVSSSARVAMPQGRQPSSPRRSSMAAPPGTDSITFANALFKAVNSTPNFEFGP